MAAQVAGRWRHLAVAGLLYTAALRARRAKSLRVLMDSCKVVNSELPTRRLRPSRGCVFAMLLAALKASLWSAAAKIG